ncbi:hypothetical protein GJ496_000479 [Pomphorhynchus laevis]|nr:hypothetical protein GJ496_000479 [Pomphorhynchus laevis]
MQWTASTYLNIITKRNVSMLNSKIESLDEPKFADDSFQHRLLIYRVYKMSPLQMQLQKRCFFDKLRDAPHCLSWTMNKKESKYHRTS